MKRPNFQIVLRSDTQNVQFKVAWDNLGNLFIAENLNLAILKILFCKNYVTLGVFKAFLFHVGFKKIKSNWTVVQKNGYSFVQK